jgi:hypothetical protein
MATNTPADSDAMPQTPAPSTLQYLPSPPITPICKRSVKTEDTGQSDVQVLWQTSSQSIVPSQVISTPRKVKSRAPSRAVKSPRVTKPRSKTPATAKLSIRRKLLETHPVTKRRTPVKSKPAVASKAPKSTAAKRPAKSRHVGKVQVKLEYDSDGIKRQFDPTDIPIIKAHPRKSVKSEPVRGRVALAKKSPKRPVKPVVGKGKGRMTNNSLSSTLHPTIVKRKGQRARTYNVGKICSSYYPSSRYLVPHSAGERYHKGKPYVPISSHPNIPPFIPSHVLYVTIARYADGSGKCAREDCKGDSLATVTRHCISEYLQKGARGSSIPRPLRLHWCNKCYMRYPTISTLHPLSQLHFPRLC